MSEQENKTKQKQEPVQPVTLKSLYKRIHAVAVDLQATRYYIQAPYFEESDARTILDHSLKSDFQILADCIEYLQHHLEIPGPDLKHRRIFRNHDPKYIEGSQWSELTFYDEIQSDESDQEIPKNRRAASNSTSKSSTTKSAEHHDGDDSSKGSRHSASSYQPFTDE